MLFDSYWMLNRCPDVGCTLTLARLNQHLAKKTDGKELQAKQNKQGSEEQQGSVRQVLIVKYPHIYQVYGDNTTGTDETHAEASEEVHGSLKVDVDKQQREQIQKAVDKSGKPEFGFSEFSGVVRDYFFTDCLEPFPFGQCRNIAMHLAVELNILHNLPSIHLQTTVEIMKANAGCPGGNPVEKPRWNGLAHRIVTNFFSSR